MNESPTFVTTQAIKAAVIGHETEVLESLGIPWRDARPHIDCPYVAHGGKDDWRWDQRKAKAFCTCCKGDSIVDVVMKCDGLADYDTAKIRTAELLGRDDLIRRRGGKGQKTDAFSLLHPPSSNSLPDLPRAYLAHRLSVSSDAVLMPTTQVAGFVALAYFDPKLPGSTKFEHVGDFPCAIFGQVAADGGIHAHRIYVAPNGAGKAALGKTPDGRDRDAKKSAKVAEGDNMAGRAVLWGDPKRATHFILAEGIETAAAVAQAYRLEIDSGEIVVAAGVNAVGVEKFQLYPQIERVTIAADRDEGVTPEHPTPSRRGDKAARTFGLLHHEAVSVDIALPGKAGESIDWLDIFVADGLEAVRVGVDAAKTFAPTQAELDGEIQRIAQEEKLRQIEAEYPLPQLDGYTLHYAFAKSGRIWLHKTILVGKGEDKMPVDVPIASPFSIPARVRFMDQEDAYGLRVHLQDMDDQRRTVDVERKDLARVGSVEARSLLFQNGLLVQQDGEKIAVECLKAADPAETIAMIRRPGWIILQKGEPPAFIGPDGTIFGRPARGSFELMASTKLLPAVAKGGTLDGWRAAVSAAVAVKDCPHWTLGVVAGFAGPLVALCEMDSAGINFSGLSSSGKTTGQRLGVSVWAKPSVIGDGLFRSAKATVNSIEAMASRANGTIFALDELAHVSGAELAKIIYTIAGNVGKARMTSGAALRENYTWRTFTVLSAETSLEEKIRSDGGAWTAGQAVRFADIDVTGINRKVDAATMAAINAIQQNYGHAGPAFVEALIAANHHGEIHILRKIINDAAVRLVATQNISAADLKADSALVRSATPFALLMIAGGLAKKFGVLPANLDVVGAVKWAWERFMASSDAVALDPEAQAFSNIRRWIAERWGSSIHPIDPERAPVRDAMGWFDKDTVYLTDHRLKEAAGDVLKEMEIAKALQNKELLTKRKSSKHLYVDYVPKIGRVKAYALSREQFGRSDGDPNIMNVYAGGRE